MITTEQFFEFAGRLLISLGGGALIIWLLSSWLGKVWANRILEKDKLKYQKELHSIKTELGRASQEYLIKFSKLQTKRANIIEELHEKLISSQRAMYSVLKLLQEEGEPPIEDKIRSLVDTFNDFYQFYLGKKIYFPKRICKQIEELAFELRNVHIYITTYPVNPKDMGYEFSREERRERKELWKHARDSFDNKASKLAEQIETEFRKLLGVNDSDES